MGKAEELAALRAKVAELKKQLGELQGGGGDDDHMAQVKAAAMGPPSARRMKRPAGDDGQPAAAAKKKKMHAHNPGQWRNPTGAEFMLKPHGHCDVCKQGSGYKGYGMIWVNPTVEKFIVMTKCTTTKPKWVCISGAHTDTPCCKKKMAKEAEKSCGGDFSKLPLDDLRADPADELSPAAKKEVMDTAVAALAALASG